MWPWRGCLRKSERRRVVFNRSLRRPDSHPVGNRIARDQILVDPGIGFGKTLDHNLILLRDIALFHGLGCPILLGASRKKFIGTISGAGAADTRVAGSVSVALHGASQGVQVIRVHDVDETRQALALWRAIEWGYKNGA